MSLTRSRAEVENALEVQRNAIMAYSVSYDAGARWEAIRLAVAVFVTVHDGGRREKSILTQLGIRGSLRFLASGHSSNPRNLLRETLLLSML